MVVAAIALLLAQAQVADPVNGPIYPVTTRTGGSGALFEFAPSSGTGMGTECACDAVTGSRGETLTYTRASSATCSKADGTITTCASNQPRVESIDSVLALRRETATTNLIVRSEELNDAAWTTNGSLTLTANNYTAPDGTLTGEKYLKTSADGVRYQSLGALGAATTTCSGWGRADSATENFSINLNCSGGSLSACTCYAFDGNACTAVTAGTICTVYTSAGTTFERLAMIATCGSGTHIASIGPGIFNSDNNKTAGLWGFQCEAKPSATSYIRTEGSTVTRAADVATVPTPALSRTEGCAAWHYRPIIPAASVKGFVGSGANVRFGYGLTTTFLSYDGTNNPSVAAGYTLGTTKRYRTTWSASGNAMVVRNVTDAAETSSAFTAFPAFAVTLEVGNSVGAGAPVEGLIYGLTMDDSATGCP